MVWKLETTMIQTNWLVWPSILDDFTDKGNVFDIFPCTSILLLSILNWYYMISNLNDFVLECHLNDWNRVRNFLMARALTGVGWAGLKANLSANWLHAPPSWSLNWPDFQPRCPAWDHFPLFVLSGFGQVEIKTCLFHLFSFAFLTIIERV